MNTRWAAVLWLSACSAGSTPVGSAEGMGESVSLVRECTVPPVPAADEVNMALDLTYAVMEGQPQRLDIAWPRAPGPHSLVVLIHGGGWSGGDRREYHSEMRLLAGHGYAAASVDYRLAAAPRNIFPAAVEDVRCAVRWLRSRAEEYSIDPARIAALGSSAGGHLAGMLGTAASVEGLDGACPLTGVSPAVRAVVAIAAPLDIRTAGMLDPNQRGMVENFLGASPEADPARALLASPAVHASAGAAPFLLIHGTADGVVSIRQSRSMRESLHAAGVPATLIELPGIGHSFPTFAPDPPLRVASCTTLAFLEQRLRPGS